MTQRHGLTVPLNSMAVYSDENHRYYYRIQRSCMMFTDKQVWEYLAASHKTSEDHDRLWDWFLYWPGAKWGLIAAMRSDSHYVPRFDGSGHMTHVFAYRGVNAD